MDRESFQEWLEAYKLAWETRTPEAAGELFTEEALYYEAPFAEPLEGQTGVVAYWSDVPRSQKQIQFDYQILAVTGNTGIAHWQASFVRILSGAFVELDGILTAEMDEDGRCRVFREWWHSKEEQQAI